MTSLPEHWVVYIRRSYKRADSGDVSDEQQQIAARALVPDGARVSVISDSGGHQSGASAEREGYQELLGLVRSGSVTGIAVYDVSRLARNASLMLPLKDELNARDIPLRAATMPNSAWDGASGRFMFGQLCLAAQYQRDVDSERMTGLTRTIFEAGGHRGADPFGYRTRRDELGRIARPRTLEVVETEAEIVRRVWADLATKSADEIAADLQREGVSRRVNRPWTRDAVKDIARRGRFYLGFVVYRRGAEERPGRHEAILDDATWARGRAGLVTRTSGHIRRSAKKRIYPLSGLLHCECKARLHGQTRSSRRLEWRYYLCRHCDRSSIRAEVLEARVVEQLAEMVLAPEAVERARTELRRRLSEPSRGAQDDQRARLETRMTRLRTQFEWGDITESEYRSKMEETRAQLAGLTVSDKVAAFDEAARYVESMRIALSVATPAQLKELLALLATKITTAGGALDEIQFVPAARPFFGAADDPRGPGLRDRESDPLDWYASIDQP